jgi:hypothetical protein
MGHSFFFFFLFFIDSIMIEIVRGNLYFYVHFFQVILEFCFFCLFVFSYYAALPIIKFLGFWLPVAHLTFAELTLKVNVEISYFIYLFIKRMTCFFFLEP